MNFFTPITSDSFVPEISFETIKIDSGSGTSTNSGSYKQQNTFTFSPAAVTSSPHLKQARAFKRSRKQHPNIPNMIDEAIYEKSLRGKGLSLVAVKKYLTEKYNINMKYSAKRIREYIKESVENGRFIRKSGYGANGSFSLSINVRNYINRKKRQSQLKRRRQSTSISKSEKAKREKALPSRSRNEKKQQ